MLAIATLIEVSPDGSKRIMRSARNERSDEVVTRAYRWLMNPRSKKAELWVVNMGIGKKGEDIVDRPFASISKKSLTDAIATEKEDTTGRRLAWICKRNYSDEPEAPRSLALIAYELDKMLLQARDPMRRPATQLDARAYGDRPDRWRLLVETPFFVVIDGSGRIEDVMEIVCRFSLLEHRRHLLDRARGRHRGDRRILGSR